MTALLVLLLFILGIGIFEIQLLLEKQKPSIYEINGELLMTEVEGFQNGTFILYLKNSGPVPVNLTEVFINKVEVITLIRQEISVNEEVTIPIIVTFSTENLDHDKKYAVGVSWTTKTGQGSYFRPFYFSSLENNE